MHTRESLINNLRSIGEDNIRETSNKNNIFVVTDKPRKKLINLIHESLQNSSIVTKPSYLSSIGYVVIDQFKILVKPAVYDVNNYHSAGILNEIILFEMLSQKSKEYAIDCMFYDNHNCLWVNNVIQVAHSSKNSVDNIKSDIIFTNHNADQFHLSIKKDNAEYWGSSDTYFSPFAQEIIENNKSIIVDAGNHFRINPNIAIKATIGETQKFIFGEDISSNGAIVTKSFDANSFVHDTRIVKINVKSIIRTIDDLTEENKLWFLIRNDKTRNVIPNYPGLRTSAAYYKRINRPSVCKINYVSSKRL